MSRWSTDEDRRQAEDMRMADAMTGEAYDGLTAEERRWLLKEARARRFSGIGRYPTTMGKVSEGLRLGLDDNGLTELWDAMDYRQQGAMYVAYLLGYEAGRSER